MTITSCSTCCQEILEPDQFVSPSARSTASTMIGQSELVSSMGLPATLGSEALSVAISNRPELLAVRAFPR
jgi:hypothetical protein